MTKRMLIDATHPEETRVAVCTNNKLEDYDFESSVRKQIKSNIYLVKVTRVEPSLQAAFVDFGGNRHGFLPFPEIHPDYYRIPIADREAILAEERELAEALAKADEERDAEEAAELGIDLDAIDLDETGEDEDDEDEETGGIIEIEDEDDDEDEDEDATAIVSSDVEEDDDSEEDDEDETHRHESTGLSADETTVTDEEENEGEDETKPAARRPADQDAAEDASDDAPVNDDAHDDETNTEDATSEDGDASAENGEGSENTHNRGRRERGRRRGRNGGRNGRGRDENGENGGNAEGEGVGDGEDGDGTMSRYRSSLKRRYKIQEVIKRSQVMLIQVSKEERGNKGAAVTTYISLPGRYCVLMPNSPRGGGVSRKVSSVKDRQRLKKILAELDIPEGMSVILRTAGVARTKDEIKRDLDYLLRMWDNIRERTLQSTAPALIYEEGSLIKRAVRDLYKQGIDEVWVEGEQGYNLAHDFMETLMPGHAEKVRLYQDDALPLFMRHQVENQIDAIHNPVVQLKSGGYIVINPTEALVSIDVNSGRATKGRHIEETALKTNLEAAEEIARQLRLRDLGGLVVIDFIDMEERRNNRVVERKLKDAMAQDRARIQLGRISLFGLLELSRQRMNPSLVETNFHTCKHCKGTGLVRTVETAAVIVLRAIAEEGIKGRAAYVRVTVHPDIAIYIMNHKREMLQAIERRHGMTVAFAADDDLISPDYKLDVTKTKIENGREEARTARNFERNRPVTQGGAAYSADVGRIDIEEGTSIATEDEDDADTETVTGEGEREPRGRRDRGRRRGRGRERGERGDRNERFRPRDAHQQDGAGTDEPAADTSRSDDVETGHAGSEGEDGEGRDDRRGRRRRGRRGGRNRNRQRGERDGATEGNSDSSGAHQSAPRPARERQDNGMNGESASAPRAASPAPAPAPQASTPPAPVDTTPKEPRRGWWKRITE